MSLPAGFVGNPRAVPELPGRGFPRRRLVLEPQLPEQHGDRHRPYSGATSGSCLCIDGRLQPGCPARTNPPGSASGSLTASGHPGRVDPHRRRLRDDVTIPNSSQGLAGHRHRTALLGSARRLEPRRGSRRALRRTGAALPQQPDLLHRAGADQPAGQLLAGTEQLPGSELPQPQRRHGTGRRRTAATNCRFEPSLSLQSDPPSAASPTALSATLHVPQHNDNPERADHLAPEEGGRQAAAGGQRQRRRGGRPGRLQRGAVRPRQRQPGELPERLAGSAGRNRQPAARTRR